MASSTRHTRPPRAASSSCWATTASSTGRRRDATRATHRCAGCAATTSTDCASHNLNLMGDRRRVIDHIGVGVRDFELSLEFYTRALAPLGFERVAFVDADNRAAGFGVHGRDDFWIHEGRPAGRMHVAFDSESREAVDAFHAAALAAGARDNGAPGLRSEYSDTYYAADILEPKRKHNDAGLPGE